MIVVSVTKRSNHSCAEFGMYRPCSVMISNANSKNSRDAGGSGTSVYLVAIAISLESTGHEYSLVPEMYKNNEQNILSHALCT